VNLDGSFRQIVRIAELRSDEEAEVWTVLNNTVTQLQAQRSAVFKRLLQQQRLHQRVKLLADALQKHRSAELDAVFQRPDIVRVGQFDDVNVVWFLHVLNPLIRLTLWIDHQWPAMCVATQPINTVHVVAVAVKRLKSKFWKNMHSYRTSC